MTRVIVEPGICGFTTAIEATKLSASRVRVAIDTDCLMAREMNDELGDVALLDALGQRSDSLVYKAADRHITHATCPVPMAILKAIEVEAGAALPKDVVIHFDGAETC